MIPVRSSSPVHSSSLLSFHFVIIFLSHTLRQPHLVIRIRPLGCFRQLKLPQHPPTSTPAHALHVVPPSCPTSSGHGGVQSRRRLSCCCGGGWRWWWRRRRRSCRVVRRCCWRLLLLLRRGRLRIPQRARRPVRVRLLWLTPLQMRVLSPSLSFLLFGRVKILLLVILLGRGDTECEPGPRGRGGSPRSPVAVVIIV